MTKDEAVTATRQGAIAACVSASITTVIVIIAFISDSDGEFAYWADPWMAIDIALILTLGYGIYRKSRVASVLMFAYFLTAKIVLTFETQIYQGLFLALVFLYFFGKAIQGSFVYHKIEAQENPDYVAPRGWMYVSGGIAATAVLLILGLLLLSTTGVIPKTYVQHGSQVSNDTLSTLRGEEIIAPAETIEYFYSYGLTSVLEGGNLLTDQGVIAYHPDEQGELLVYRVKFSEITDIKLESEGTLFEDRVYRLNTIYPDAWIFIYLSEEKNRHKEFIEALRNKIES